MLVGSGIVHHGRQGSIARALRMNNCERGQRECKGILAAGYTHESDHRDALDNQQSDDDEGAVDGGRVRGVEERCRLQQQANRTQERDDAHL